MGLGDRVRQRRRRLGITQGDLAKALGITPQHVSAIEQETRTPSLQFLVGLAQHLGVTTDYLLTGREQPSPDTIAVIRGDETLALELRQALVAIIENLRRVQA